MTMPFRFAGLWQWNPVSCVTPRSYDEKAMMRRGAWFFDRAFMARYFDALREAGLNTWTLANTHPFPFMVNLEAFPDAVVLSQSELARYQDHYHWLFEAARARGLKPFVLFHTCYVPDAFGKKHGIRPRHSFEPPPLAVDYTRHCVRELCRTYPELEGIHGEASENVAAARRATFARQAIVEGIHESGRRPVLFMRGWLSDPVEMREQVQAAYAGECFFTVKYTWEFLVHARPDPEFRRWVDACGAGRILPEFWISNYQPFGCHDLDLAQGIRRELQALGCPGFTSHPMDLYGAPFVQGGGNVLQAERDRDWYATLSGAWADGPGARARGFGFAGADELSAAAKAACRPFQRISYYLTGNKQNFLQPQWLANISGSPERRAGLHVLDQWARLAAYADQSYGRWMEQIDGQPVRYPGETREGFGLENLLEELDRLDEAWIEPPPCAPGQAKVYEAWRRDVVALRLLAQAWRERGRAVLAHGAGRAKEAAAALGRSLDHMRRLPDAAGGDGPYRLLVGRHVVVLRWSELTQAMEEERTDYAAGRLKPYYFFGEAEHYDQYGKDFASREPGPVPAVTALRRPRCRIAWGEPGENGEGWEAAPLLPAMTLDSSWSGALPSTEVRALAHARALCLRFVCRVDDPGALRLRSSGAGLAEGEHVFFEIMPRNDPTDRWRIAGTFAAGAIKVTRSRVVNGEASLGGVYDVWRTGLSAGTAGDDIRTCFGVGPDHWWMEFVVPWASLGLPACPPVIGFQFGRAAVSGGPDFALVFLGWPKAARDSACPRLIEPGEALLGPDSGAPEGIELDRPCFGANRGRLNLGPLWPQRPRRLSVRVEAPDGAARPGPAVEIELGDAAVEFEYTLCRAHSSHAEPFATSTLVFEIGGAGDQRLYQARLPLDRHLGICVDEPFGFPAEEISGTPARERWLDEVVRALPRLHRRTTAQGAVSDFCLCHEDGRLAVNLMGADAWRALAAIVEERFATREDRLVAAMALVGQKTVTNLVLAPMFFNAAGAHTYHSAQHELMGPLSILRYGGGPAVSRAAVLAGLLQRLVDPQTGRPFVTRVVSLTNQGGPRQVTRRYEGCSNLAPFVQQPGRVGAVAVDYGGSQTLLDPTALAFFPAGARALATVEQMVADGALREQGAGRLAPVYAKLDIAELRRHPADRLLSKGVFPELSLDEDGGDRPPSAGERQLPRTLRAGPEGGSASGLRDGWGRPGRRDGEVSVRANALGLTIRVAVRGVDPAAFDPRDREIERVHLALDPAHAHEHILHFAAGLEGERSLWRESASGIQTLFKHLSTENHIETAALAGADWTASFVPRGGQGYDVAFAVAWETLGWEKGAARPPVIGLNVWVEGRHPEYEQVFLAPPRWRLPVDPFSFADLLLTESNLEIQEIDLGTPCWGGNEGRVVIENRGPAEARVQVRAETHLSMRRVVHRLPAVTVTVPPGGSAAAVFPFVADPEEKMTAGQALVLVAESAGGTWFRGQWRLTYCGPVSVYQRYGRALGLAPRPAPGDEAFIRKKVDFICSRIPAFQRRTTRDGAPSDFVVRAEDGSVQFDFMQAGVLDHLADYVTRLFDNDLDILLGMLFLSHNPAFARHSSAGHRFMAGAGPLSLIRAYFAGGGGNCGPHACVFSGLASRLRLGGAPLAAHQSGIAGHNVSVVAWQGVKALIDADVGHIFLKPDGSGLATLDDFRAGVPIITTAGPGDLGRYFTFQEGRLRHQSAADYEAFEGVFPPGGPSR